MREISVNPAFFRDVRRLKRKHYDMGPLIEAQATLRRNDRTLLTGRHRGHRPELDRIST